ncbi:MAG: DUF4230 domain-containing protein [Acidobacteria bacterium]|nr:DUF4230 domain-containing protein [Acidobacteriota bacterium]
MTIPQTPNRTLARTIGVVAAFFIAAVFAVGLLLANLPSFNIGLPAFIVGEPFQEVGLVVVDELQELAELTTVEMVETTTIQRGDDHGILNLALGDRLHLFAVARIGAGVDLSELTEDSFAVNQETGVLAIEIPRAEVFYAYLDSNSTTVLDRDTGLFTKGDDLLESDTRAEAERILEAQAIEAGILDRAQTSAENFLTGFFTSLGYTDVVIETVDFP